MFDSINLHIFACNTSTEAICPEAYRLTYLHGLSLCV